MSETTHHRPSKHKRRHRDEDAESKTRKKDKHDKDETSKKRHKTEKSKKEKVRVIDDDAGEDVWVEKNIDMDGENVSKRHCDCCSLSNTCTAQPLATDIPTAESLNLKSRAVELPDDPPLPPSKPTESKLVRDEWMLLPPSAPSVPSEPSSSRLTMPTGNDSLTEDYGDLAENGRTLGGGVDFFSSLGTERRRKPKEEKVDDKVRFFHLFQHFQWLMLLPVAEGQLDGTQ